MSFGIPGSTDGNSGPFLSRVQYDARSGFFTNVDRVQDADGKWADKMGKPYRDLRCAVDFGSMEVGYIKFASPPSFLLVPYLGDATTYPQQPQELGEAKPGEKPRKAFQPGFRVKLLGKAFSDAEPRHFASTSKAVLTTMEALYRAFVAAPEAAKGLIPVVETTDARTFETSGPRGTTRNYGPEWSIVQWIERPAAFGERTCPAPTFGPFVADAKPPAALPAAHVAAAAMPAAVSADPLPF